MGGRQPPLGLLGGDREVTFVRVVAALVGLLLTLSACSGDPKQPPQRPTTTASPSPTKPPVPPSPAAAACYRLAFKEAISPISHSEPVACAKRHTSRTFHVGRLSRLFPAGVPAIDVPRVQQKVGAECTRRLTAFVGGSPAARLLSMLRPVWFTPTLAEADAGAAWFRCDVVALGAENQLAPLTGRLAKRLDRPGWQQTYGLCATAQPGTKNFHRVSCARKHSWVALSTVPLTGGRYPGVAAVRARGEDVCKPAARDLAADKLDYQWGYEWPTLAQWRAGTRNGVCWLPR